MNHGNLRPVSADDGGYRILPKTSRPAKSWVLHGMGGGDGPLRFPCSFMPGTPNNQFFNGSWVKQQPLKMHVM